MIEPKGLDAYPVRNCIRLDNVAATPTGWSRPALTLGATSCLNVSDAKKQDSAYFAAIAAADGERRAGSAAATFFSTAIYPKFNVRDVPQTGCPG